MGKIPRVKKTNKKQLYEANIQGPIITLLEMKEGFRVNLFDVLILLFANSAQQIKSMCTQELFPKKEKSRTKCLSVSI